MDDSVLVVVALVIANLIAWGLVWRVAARRRGDRTREARPPAPAGQRGALAPLAPVGRTAPPEPPPEPDPTPEPARALLRVLGAATTYEIVWYREDERLVFALQPVDGRSALRSRVVSGSFAWGEDRDPPPGLRVAQREHGRLSERLLREGWTRAGRGVRWYSHRFRPPA